MGNLLTQTIKAFAGIMTIIIAYVVFSPVINDNLQSYVLETLASPTGALVINSNALYFTNNIIVMGLKVFVWFAVIAIVARYVIFSGWKTEEQEMY